MSVLSAADLACWETNGFVRVESAVGADQAARTAAEVWAFASQSPDNPASWARDPPGIMVEMYHGECQWQNRTAPRVHGAFSQLWGTERLREHHDRCSIAPPMPLATALALVEEGGTDPAGSMWPVAIGLDGQPEHGLHWDAGDLRGTPAQARAARPLRLGMQGVIYLVDTPPEQGALVVVAGFHRRIDEWLGTLPPALDETKDFSLDLDFRSSLLQLGTTRVGGKAGDLVRMSCIIFPTPACT
jgi:hypothetical protein